MLDASCSLANFRTRSGPAFRVAILQRTEFKVKRSFEGFLLIASDGSPSDAVCQPHVMLREGSCP